jgi:hypothetical protein
MKNFLEKLDRKAGNWLDTLDEQLQQPIVQTLSGEVFTHGTSLNGHSLRDQSVQMAQPSTHMVASRSHELETVDGDDLCPPVLRNANALSGR